MKKLRITFQNEDGTKKSMTLHLVDQNLKPQKVYDLAVQIAELELFEKDGVKLMTKVLSACYVADGVQVLFSVCRNETGETVVFSPMLDPKAVGALLSDDTPASLPMGIFLQALLFWLFYLPAEKLRRCLSRVILSNLHKTLSQKLLSANPPAFCPGQTNQGLLL